ncbi:MAG: T9SS type A sorting domain-containing protein, partial [Bacteroidota bacterium]
FIGQNYPVSEMYRTADAGQSWNQISLPAADSHAVNLYEMQFLDADNGYVTAMQFDTNMIFPIGFPSVFRTTDGGQNWADVTPPDLDQRGLLAFSSMQHGVVMETEHRHLTTDGGQTWFSTVMPNTGVSDVQFVSADTGYVTGFVLAPNSEAWMAKTINGGASWFDVDLSSFGSRYARHLGFMDADNGWAVLDSTPGAVIHTTDGGQTWTANTHSLNASASVEFIDAMEGYWLDGADVLRTTDGGSTWATDLTLSGAGIFQKLFDNASGTYVSGDNGEIYVRDQVLAINALTQIDFAFGPNPAAAATTVLVNAPEGVHSVHLLDIQGRRLQSMEGNGQQIRIPTPAVSGTYFLEVRDAEGNALRKRLLIQ